MHVLTATRRTQGQRPDDFSWTVEGELVRFAGVVCANPDCGCDRAFAGLASSKPTTTAEVVDLDHLDRATYVAALRDALGRERWINPGNRRDEEFVGSWADDHLRAAAALPAGTVVEVRDGMLAPRERSGSDA